MYILFLTEFWLFILTNFIYKNLFLHIYIYIIQSKHIKSTIEKNLNYVKISNQIKKYSICQVIMIHIVRLKSFIHLITSMEEINIENINILIDKCCRKSIIVCNLIYQSARTGTLVCTVVLCL